MQGCLLCGKVTFVLFCAAGTVVLCMEEGMWVRISVLRGPSRTVAVLAKG